MQKYRRKQRNVLAWQVPETIGGLRVYPIENPEENYEAAFPGDWIVEDTVTKEIGVFSDEEFQLAFEQEM